MFNLQSGLHRQSFPAPRASSRSHAEPFLPQRFPLTVKSSLNKSGVAEGKHTGEVSGLAIDSLNRVVVSCGLDGRIKVGVSPSTTN
jgi:U3 small nucleolar RNA-associated protein 21